MIIFYLKWKNLRFLIILSFKLIYFNLKFNACKSIWISAKKHKGKKFSLEETYNVEEAFSYKYLGIIIDQNGCINCKQQSI